MTFLKKPPFLRSSKTPQSSGQHRDPPRLDHGRHFFVVFVAVDRSLSSDVSNMQSAHENEEKDEKLRTTDKGPHMPIGVGKHVRPAWRGWNGEADD